jgi:putative transposase
VDGEIKTVTIKREVDRWYVCFSVEATVNRLPAVSEEAGIDVGVESFAVLSDGTEIDNPRYLERGLRKLRRTQRRVARRRRGSKRRRKAAVLLAKVFQKIRNQRSNFHHEVSSWLVNKYQLIAVEALNVRSLSRGMLARSVHDAAWRFFFNKLAYKAERADRQLIEVDARGTSQTCTCGAAVPKTLADRWHKCPTCGLSGSRDHVSAQVILQRARIVRSRPNAVVLNASVPREAVGL